MPVVSSLANLPKDGEFYSNNCVDGHCIGCGECCTDLLPTTRREIVRLRDYAKKHQLKEHRLPAGAALESVDLTCPFRNETTGTATDLQGVYLLPDAASSPENAGSRPK